MTAKNVVAIYALSPQQQGMLFDTLQLSDSGVHIEQKIYVLCGELDVGSLERAWQYLIARHSILRTGFVWKNQGEPLQCVLREVDLRIVKHDWRGLSQAEQRERFDAYLEEDRRRGFELAKPPLMRLALFQMSDEEHQLVFTHHHIVLDGWCRPIIDKEVQRLYGAFCKGESVDLPPVRPYRDYIAWLKRQILPGAERFWRGVLSGISEPTPLGIETTASVDDREVGFGELRIQLSANTAEKLKQLTREHHVTLNSLVQGLWALMLNRYSGSNDVIFGTTVSGRPTDLEGSDAMLGLFINTLPFRVTIRDGSIWKWLSELQAQHLEMRQYEYCSSGQIHQWCQFPGSLPLYESILVFENYPGNSDRPPSILSEAQTYSIGAQTRYPLNILVLTRPGLELLVVFDRSRFVEANVPALRDHFVALCEAMVANPAQDLKTLAQQIPGDEAPRIRAAPRAATRPDPRDYEAPRNACEKKLAEIWTDVLGVDHLGIHDDFFALKGHSLLATQVLSRTREAFAVQLPLRCLFESPTIAALAQRIDSARKEELASVSPPLVRVSKDGPLPLSFAQQRLWFLNQLQPDSPSYNVSMGVRISGNLKLEALEQALNAIVARHEALRTVFVTIDDQPVQMILDPKPFAIPTVDLMHLPTMERESEAQRLLTREAEVPIDLSKGPMLRATLVRLDEKEHVLSLNTHHIVSDGWSMAILFRELGTFYEANLTGTPAQLPDLKIQYADYAVWQRNWLQGDVLEREVNHWKQQLAGAPLVLELPLDKPRPAVQSVVGARVRRTIGTELSQALEKLSRDHGATLFMTLLASFQLLLSRYTAREDIVVGTDLANRTRVETEDLIGFFVNLLPIRTDLTGNPKFTDLIHRIKEVVLETYAHQDVPFEKLVEALQPTRDLSRNPLVQVLFVMQNTPHQALDLPGLELSRFDLEREYSRFDLVLFVSQRAAQLECLWVYNSDLFEANTAVQMSERFETLLESIISDPTSRLADLEMESQQEREKRAIEDKDRKRSREQGLRSARRRGVDLSTVNQVNTSYLRSDEPLPLLVEPAREAIDLVEWAGNNQQFIANTLLRHGALLFRGFEVDSIFQFQQFASAICPELFGEYGDLPREEFGGKVYGSTPYPADETILFHNESSHMHRWPMLIWFYCVKAADQGGETPIVDCRQVYQSMTPATRKQFEQKGLMYVRNFTDSLDVSWQEFFRTSDKTEVERYCRRNSIDIEWKGDNGLRTRQVCPAVAQHPQTGEMVFFNQLQLHHISCLTPQVRHSLLSMMNEEDLPRNVYYGDGSVIEDSVVEYLRDLYQEKSVSFRWQARDVLMLNNMLVAHSRNPYVGERKIVVALGNVVTKEQVEQAAQSSNRLFLKSHDGRS